MKADILVGIGASAGGLEALQALLSNLQAEVSDMALVIAQHVSPTYKSQLVELLARQTTLPVREAVDGDEPEGGVVYITPPDRDIAFSAGVFQLTKPSSTHGPRPSIDHFFSSSAKAFGDRMVGVILSGTGSDGSQGVRAVQAAGGLVIVQDPETAKYNGMPLSALEKKVVDIVAEADAIGEGLVRWSHGERPEPQYEAPSALAPISSSLEVIIRLLSEYTGTDFSRYKPATIGRRLQKRITSLGLETIDDYLEILQTHPDELDQLFASVLIGVTYFFRDQESFAVLRENLEEYLTNPEEKVRVWVPGCASGEEAYSIAILIAEILGDRLRNVEVQIFATDLDEKALSCARKGVYPESVLENVSSEILATWFVKRTDGMYEVVPAIRSMVLFSRHDITRNPPFLKLDLISCRNLLIYFGAELQQHVLPLFHYSLKPNGFLFLGKSETIGGFSDLFEGVVPKQKLFRRAGGSNPYAGLYLGAQAAVSTGTFPRFRAPISAGSGSKAANSEPTISEMVKETLYHGFEHPYVVINSRMEVLEVFGDMSGFLSIKQGVMNAGLLSLIDDRYELELRSLLTKAIRENSSAVGCLHRLGVQEAQNAEATQLYLRFSVKPILYSGSRNALYIVMFEHISLDQDFMVPLKEDDSSSSIRERELENELRSTREHLQNYIEELETSTEELQSLNEELQSTNEELQSSNEELETSNEELQSTNEELQIAYSELKTVSDEVTKSRHRLQESEGNLLAVLGNTLQAFILIDRAYRVLVHNQVALDVMQQLAERELAVGVSIIDFFPGDMLEAFKTAVISCFEGKSVGETRRILFADGSAHWFRLQFTPAFDEHNEVMGVSLAWLDITEQKENELALDGQRRLNELILDSAQAGIALIDEDGRFVQVNRSYCEVFGYREDELIGKRFSMLLPEGVQDYSKRQHERFLQGEAVDLLQGEKEMIRKDGSPITVLVNAGRLQREDGSVQQVTTVSDITFRKQAEEERNRLFSVSLDLMCIIGFDGYLQQVNPAWEYTLGFTTEFLLSKPITDFVHQDDKKLTLDFLQQIIENPEASHRLENRIIAADGEEHWLAWNTTLVVGKRLVYAVARDITDARRQQLLLRDTQRVARVGGWELDIQTGKTSWTEEVYSIYEIPLGVETDYMQGLEAYEPEDRKLVREAIARASEMGESSDMEIRFTSAAGRKMWVRVTFKGVATEGRIQKVMGTIQDITREKVAKLENQRLSLVASQTDNGVIIADSRGRIEWVNHGFEQMTGSSLASFSGLFLERAFAELGAGKTELGRVIRVLKGQESAHEEMHLVMPGGTDMWIMLDITPVLNEDGKIGDWIVLVHDVTQSKQFEQRLIKAKEEAEEMNRLKSAFLANMSHEIRTPLNGILGMAHIIQKETTETDTQEYASLLEQSGQRLLRTINQVLDLSKLEARQIEVNAERLEVNEICQRLCDMMEPAAEEKGLRLVWKPYYESIFVHADAWIIENIVLNLIGNAIKFTLDGLVTVAIRSRQIKKRRMVVVEVQDTGIGMKKGYLNKIFQPFSQESTGQARKFEGTGLGLSISHEYALLIHGEIDVVSHFGKGSTFRLLLPQIN